MRKIDHALLLTTGGGPGSANQDYRLVLRKLVLSGQIYDALLIEIQSHAKAGLIAYYARDLLEMLAKIFSDGRITEKEFRALANFLKSLLKKAVEQPEVNDRNHLRSLKIYVEGYTKESFEDYWDEFVEDTINLFRKWLG